MALDTSLIGPLFRMPEEKQDTNFLRAFEQAKEQSSPMALAQLQEQQQRIQHMGFQLQRDQIGLQMDKDAQVDLLKGKAAAGEMAGIMAETKDYSDPSFLAAMYKVHAKNPTKEGDAMLKEGEARLDKALAAKDKSEKLELSREKTAAEMENKKLGLELAGERILTTQEKARADLTEKQLDRQRKESTSKARLQVITQQAIEKDKLLNDLNDQLSSAQSDVKRYSSENPSLIGKTGVAGRTKSKITEDLQNAKRSVTDIQRQIQTRESQLRDRMKVMGTDEGVSIDEEGGINPTQTPANDPAGIRSLLAP